MIYSFGLALYMLLAAPFYLLRVMRGRYRVSVAQRMGRNLAARDDNATTATWLHACSVGEVEAAKPVVEILMRERPGNRIIISTVTETGQARARQLFPAADIRYLPFDFAFAVRRHLDSVGTLDAFWIMETEIWPNLIRNLHARGIPIFIANGRISDRAWPRYRRFAFLFRPILALVAGVAARTEEDAERFRFLGATHVQAVGNVKFDRPAGSLPLDPPHGRFLVFGSSHPGEEELFLRVYQALLSDVPGLRMILAPRHIERAEAVAAATGGARRSKGWHNESVLLLDTHGELGGMYALADVAVIGGSFVPVGGHNPLEAAIHGIPTLWGPHIANFRDACSLLEGHGGSTVADEHELIARIRTLLHDNSLRRQWGEQARATVEANRGATERNWTWFLHCTGAPPGKSAHPVPAGDPAQRGSGSDR